MDSPVGIDSNLSFIIIRQFNTSKTLLNLNLVLSLVVCGSDITYRWAGIANFTSLYGISQRMDIPGLRQHDKIVLLLAKVVEF